MNHPIQPNLPQPLLASRPMEGSDQARRALLGILEDLQQAEAAQRKSLQRFEIVSRATNDAVWDWDPIKNTIWWSETFLSLFGFSRSEIEPGIDSWILRIHPDDLRRVNEGIHAVLDGNGEFWSDEYRFLCRDGSYSDILDRGFVVRDSTGHAIRMLGAMQDITARKRVEREYNRIFMLSPDMICTCGLDGYFKLINPRFETTLGFTVQELKQEPLLNFVHADDHAATEKEFARLGKGEATVEFVNRYRTKKGTYRWLEWNTTYFPGENLVYGVARDITDRITSEEALRNSEKRLRDLINGLGPSMFIATLNLDGLLIDVNQPAVAAAGLPIERLRGIPMGEVYSWSYSKEIQQQIRETVLRAAGGVASRFDTKIRIGENKFLDIDFSLQPMLDERGAVSLLVASGIDITERKSAEMGLQESEERYRLAVHGSFSGIWDWNLLTQKVNYSPRIAEILGITMAELPDTLEDFTVRLHPDDQATNSAALHAHLQERVPYNVEYRMRTHSSEYRWLNVRGQALWDASGRAYRMAGSLLDIHERKMAEKALENTTELLTRTGEIAKVGGFKMDLATMKGHVSEEIYRILEIDRSKPVDLATIMNAIPIEARAEVESKVRIAIAYGVPLHLEYPMITGTGRRIWVHSMATSEMENGKPVRRVGAIQDITDRKLAELALGQLNAELELRVKERTKELGEKNQELEAFSYSVSHDLKAPLRSIDGYGKLLLEDYCHLLDEQGKQFLANILTGASQMYQLIEDMLAYSRIERRSPTLVSLDLGIAITEVLAEIRPSLTLVQLTLDIHSGSILGDKEALAVALRNLIDNAIKFSQLRKPPRVEIHSHLHGDRHILSVRDNGTGFSMKHHDSIFKIFHRLHRAEDFPGTGVGLALVKKAMERMNGSVWAESEQDNGAEFFLEFQRS